MTLEYKKQNKEFVKGLMQQIDDEQVDRKNSWDSLIDFLKPYYGKYVRLRIIDDSPGKENIVREYVGMPYNFIDTNQCLFGIWCKPSDTYKGGVSDSCIELNGSLRHNHILDITPITEQEFYDIVNNSIKTCINIRESKIADVVNYTLTATGYKFMNWEQI